MAVGGVPVVAQVLSSASSSTCSEFPLSSSHSGGQLRSSLRGSASLQDFSPYRHGGLPRSPSLVGAFGPTLSQQVARNDGGVAILTTIKSNIVRRPVGAVAVSFCNDNGCTRRKIVVALVALVGTLILLHSFWSRNSRFQNKLEYAVVIDCGSTGSRAHVYGWIPGGVSGKASLPTLVYPPLQIRAWAQRNDGAPTFGKKNKNGQSRAYKRMETEPGLDKLVHNESGIKSAIEPLIDWASKQIPPSAHRRTQLFFLATAGLRKLALADSKWLLDKAWLTLVRSPFICRREWVRIITGQEEAYFGWIALNYNVDRLGHTPKQPTLGALDLGGSSLEVTFEPDEIPKAEYLVNVSVGSVNHILYAHSHPGFGLNDAFEKSVAWLVEDDASSLKESKEGSVQVAHPCLNAGYKQPFLCSSYCVIPSTADAGGPLKEGNGTLTAQELVPKIELIGKPNWAECQSLVQSVINTSGLSKTLPGKGCEQPPCALGKHQPQPQGQFFALAGFFVVYNFFGLTSTSSLDDLLHKGQQFCKLKWEEAQQIVLAQPSIDRYCFRAPYVVGLLRQGLHLNDEQVRIGSGDFAWTLGAALNEAGTLLPSNLRGTANGSFLRLGNSGLLSDVHALTFLFVVALLAVLLLTCSWKWVPSHFWPQPYLPLFVPPNVSSGPFSWCPPTFRSLWRPGSSPGAGVGSPGDGRVKVPHSPVPFGPKSGFRQQMFESGAMHVDHQLLMEADTLQLPSSAGSTSSGGRSQLQAVTVMMQPKGGSRLQSRRTQSREDLSSYLAPDRDISKAVPSWELLPMKPLRHDFTI